MNGQLRLEDELGTLTIGVPDRPQPINARAEINRLQTAGLGPSAIARKLNLDRIPTPSGRGHWRPEQVIRTGDPARHAAYMRQYRARRR